MAAPGEIFPQQFAMGILRMAQQQKQQAAELAEMRRQRASREFIAKEASRNEQARLALEAAREGRLAEAQQQSEEVARIEAEQAAKDLEIRRAGVIQKGIADFSNNGLGYFPIEGFDQVQGQLGDAELITTDSGIIAINQQPLPDLNDTVSEEQRKLRNLSQKQRKAYAELKIDMARADYYAAKNRNEAAKRNNYQIGATGSVETVKQYGELFETIQKSVAKDIAFAKTQRLELLGKTKLSSSEARQLNELTARLERARANPAAFYPEDHPTRKKYEHANNLFAEELEALDKNKRNGLDVENLPRNPNKRLSQQLLGQDEEPISEDPLDIARENDEPWSVLPTNVSLAVESLSGLTTAERQRFAGQSADFYSHESGLIPLNEAAAAMVGRTRLPLSPLARRFGFRAQTMELRERQPAAAQAQTMELRSQSADFVGPPAPGVSVASPDISVEEAERRFEAILATPEDQRTPDQIAEFQELYARIKAKAQQ